MAEGRGSATLYRIDFMRNLNLVVKIVGEGNSEVVDDYSIICMHGVVMGYVLRIILDRHQ